MDSATVLQKRAKEIAPGVTEVDILSASDEELVAISQATSIGLKLDEMQRVRDHFKAVGRNPRDIELEALGQAWSEHCCYKSSKPVLKAHVYGVNEERLVAREDAGVMPFDDKHHYVVKIESHNHPSAVEPYGGAATGVGGVLRDVVCMGAQPIALVDPLFFGPLDTPFASLPPGTKHPKYLFGGVVAGIRDYGNRIGIPTVAGGIHFHPKFVTNNLVNVGCIGIMEKERLIHSRVGNVGDVYVLLGGKTGRDGIHGVTFASKDLASDAEDTARGAVQLGDPITKEPLVHACLEANEKGLLTGFKDLGGGGLSCVCGEMALDAGMGANIHLDRVHLKQPNMKPWEIWVSESQERMMVTVLPADVEKVLAIAKKWDVDAAVLGEAVADKVVRVLWHGTTIFEMDSEFLYGGPVYQRPYTIRQIEKRVVVPAPRRDYSEAVLELLGDQNICSRDIVIRQYDHEVRGNTAIKPLQGKIGKACHGDAVVLKPVHDNWKGLAITTDACPHLTDIDPYWGTMATVDESVRNLAAVGARLDGVADNLNFANPEKPERMGDIWEATRGLGEAVKALGVPFVSGNVSLYNESPTTPVPPTPTLLSTGIVSDVRKCVTTDLKAAGDTLYLVGTTKDEMGGSAWYRISRGVSTVVPRTDLGALRTSAEAVVTAIEGDLVAACHDVSEGGLAVTLAEMALGGDVGVRVALPDWLAVDVALFSESCTRWVVECKPGREANLEAHFRSRGVALTRLGTVEGNEVRISHGGGDVVRVKIDQARKTWENGLHKFMG